MCVEYPETHEMIMCIDMKSFYASCSSLLLGLEPLESCLAVVGDKERKGSVVLAASPLVKKLCGITTGARLYEVKDTHPMHVVHPKMRMYLHVSMEITRLLYRYVDVKDLHVYSVDECFVRLDFAMKQFGCTARQLAEKIQADITRQFGLPCTIGIGPNMLMSKFALDLEAKKVGIATWEFSDIKQKLWP
ncbi:MAG: UV damage repair protein UvrX, partial [Bacilli bacterium]